MPEQLVLDEVGRHGTAVHRHKGCISPTAQFVNGPGYKFLPGTGLAGEEYHEIRRGDQRRLFKNSGDVLARTHGLRQGKIAA